MRQPVLFGRYLLLERISVGGMAEIFKAKTFGVEGFEKIIAIKRILPSMAEDRDFIAMFIDEAKIAGQLSHANICQIFELGRIENAHFIAMEYVRGRDVLQIQHRLRRLGRHMPLSMTAFITASVCEGLEYAHRKLDSEKKPLNIVHRDVSPQNILVSYEGEVKIIDFGIAKAVSRSAKTRAGVLKGKFGYMSPEQVRGQPVDRRSDVFAMGTVLWEMCTGERLFTGSSDLAVLDKVRNAVVPRPSLSNPEVPPELEMIVMRALRRDPAERFQWAGEMQDALRGFLVKQKPRWTSATLSATLKELFQPEMAREQAAFERYKGIRPEDISHQDPIGRRVTSPVPGGVVAGREPLGAPMLVEKETLSDFGEDLDPAAGDGFGADGGLTEISGPPGMLAEHGSVHEPTLPGELEEPLPAVIEPVGFEGGVTTIYGEQIVGFESLKAEPTFVYNPKSGQLIHATHTPAESTTIFGSGNGSADGRHEAVVASGPTVIFDAALLTGADEAALAASDAGEAQGGRGRVLTDVLIGVGIGAALLAVAVVAWRVYEAATAVRPATLVVSGVGEEASQVFVDGVERGRLTSGVRLKIKPLEPGAHRITLVGDEGQHLASTVSLAPGEVKIMSLAAPRVDRADRAEEAPAVVSGAVEVLSKPDKATVTIDGEVRGKTPLSLSGLPAGSHHVVVTLSGFEPASAEVTVRHGAPARVSLALRETTPAKPDAAEASRDRAPKPPLRSHAATTSGTATSPTPRPRATSLSSGASEGARQPRSVTVRPTHRTRSQTASPSRHGRGDGYLVANTTPWAAVVVDGKATGRTTPIVPRKPIVLKPGKHKIVFVVGKDRFSYDVVIVPGRTTRLIKQLDN